MRQARDSGATAIRLAPSASHLISSSRRSNLSFRRRFSLLYSPQLPTTISTGQDLLNLPFAGAVVGVGDPASHRLSISTRQR